MNRKIKLGQVFSRDELRKIRGGTDYGSEGGPSGPEESSTGIGGGSYLRGYMCCWKHNPLICSSCTQNLSSLSVCPDTKSAKWPC
ncbi:hypothetical protein SAMN05421820_101492 [Pedobacter steynii]|uniref:Uncharacterized protein n=1 Tax=Pedobacter steynii TaxID=430522 RepID=A0A1G9K7C4_9SPHI|nr:hypothetical protein SAMN05421820_101492 [Pedobacter steynii]